MDAEGIFDPSSDIQVLARKSWTGYVGSFLRNGAIILLGIAFLANDNQFGWILIAPATARMVYMFYWHRSHVLYSDKNGVWHSRGLLPWSKGVTGVKWRDLDQANFGISFFSWLTNSYLVRVGHRYTQGAELVFTHARQGKDSVRSINQSHSELAANGSLS